MHAHTYVHMYLSETIKVIHICQFENVVAINIHYIQTLTAKWHPHKLKYTVTYVYILYCTYVLLYLWLRACQHM